MKKINTPSSEKKAQRKKPTANVSREVYARAAGRCLICHRHLLEAEDLGQYAYNMGEMAHIVGQSLDPKSARSADTLAKDLRDEADNFMLLCRVCHDNIDALVPREDFTVTWLRNRKEDQEAHIKHVTGLPQSHRTCVVRLVGAIRGKTVQVVPAECNSATLYHAVPRFAFYPLVYGRQEVEFDLVKLGDPETNPGYWEQAQHQIQMQLTQIRMGVEQGEIEHLSVFAFARIPLLVYFGFALGNKVGATLYQRRRVEDKPWHWLADESSAQQFEWECLQVGTDKQRVALLLNISGTIQIDELPEEFNASYSIFVIRPSGIDPQPDVLLSEASFNVFRACYRRWLAHWETKHKAARRIHVFAAVPAAVAVAIGADLMPHTQPELVIYDRIPREFKLALTIN